MPELSATTPARVPHAGIWHVLGPKWRTARARTVQRERGRWGRAGLLIGFGGLFWILIYELLIHLLLYFKSTAEIGELLAGKLLGLILVGFFAILLLSNVITALSSFFLARDLEILVAGPVDWLTLYAAKLIETAINSSWMVVLMAVPMFAAYGQAYGGGPAFPLVVLGTFLPYVMIPAAVGSAVTLLLVNIFPARRTRDILSVIAVLTAAGIVVLFRAVRPERLVRPEGFRSLVDFVAVLRTPTSPFLPSEWVERSIMSWLGSRTDLLPIYLLWTTAAAVVAIGAILHWMLYDKGFSKAQESAQRWARGRLLTVVGGWLLKPAGVTRRELVLKEVRLFFRDTTQWSQLVLLAVLVVVYVVNINLLPVHGQGVSAFLVNLIPFLNLVLAGFVLASIAARFIFPGVSLEGRTLWLLRSSPMSTRELLWSKYWVGTMPLLALAVCLVGVTNILLDVSDFMMWLSLLTIVVMTLAVSAMALAFGTVYPQFETENAAQIPTSYGGLLFMMAAVTLIGGIIVLEARPVMIELRSVALGEPADPLSTVIGLGSAAVVGVAATIVPIRIALRKLELPEG